MRSQNYLVFFVVVVLFCFLTCCAAVRLGGRIYQGAGDAMVKTADEEEAKRAKKARQIEKIKMKEYAEREHIKTQALAVKGGVKTRAGSEASQEQAAVNIKEGVKKDNKILTISKKHSSVNVRPEPSTNQAPIATLKGGDKVEKIEAKGGWIKIRFNNSDDKQMEGWISKTLVE